MAIDIVTIIGSLVTSLGEYHWLLLGRVILGIGVGVNTTLLPIYIQEIAPLSISGILGSCF